MISSILIKRSTFFPEKFADRLLAAKFDDNQTNLASVEQDEDYLCYVRHFIK